ncbi:anti-sigma factor family protein [Patulibacter minatonensis]|uniref:anti-sigma factor family protein n=1 Tax=Patulibacter minatonensis TaxID=298163 RepID=UPI00047BC026|nr:hypothetical protein [Patulibacter minatonensis]
MSTPDDPRLECGVPLLELVAQVADRTPPADPAHQAECPYCREALARLDGSAADLRALASEDVRPPRGLSARVLEQLRRERGRILVAAGRDGRDTVTDVIVAQIASRAAMELPPVRFVSVRTTQEQDGGVHLVLHVTADLGPALGPVATEIRDVVTDRVARLAGVAVTRVDVVFDDVVA